MERRLAAVLAADVAGYSRLMGGDEEGTLASLKAARKSQIDPKIENYRGRIVKTTGDGVLAEFASAVDAARCAIEIQSGMALQNKDVPQERQIVFRIGIHIGDIIFDDNDIFGDGVNIAARLEGIADIGGLCLSDDAYRQVRGKIEAEFEDGGPQVLKNIAEPMRVWRLKIGGITRKPIAETSSALTLPDRPSIAVLPFQNMSGDPEQEFFADGISEDVITALSRFSSLFVISRNSSFSFKGRTYELKQIGCELGVRYVLEGSLRKAGNRVRVTAQLIEAETGNHVWAERYDRDLADIFAVQDEIAQATTVAIAPAIADAERKRAMRKAPANLDAWSSYQRGMWHLGKASAEDDALAEKFFQNAVDRDPMFAGGYIGLATVLSRAKGTQAKEEEMARRAVALETNNAEAHARLALALLARGDHASATAQAEQALALCPNLADAHGALGVTLAYSGRAADGVVALTTCIRLDPCAPSIVNRLNQIALAHYFCRDYEAAIDAAERAIRSFPDFPSPYRWRAAALGELGRSEEAKAAPEKAIKVSPGAFEFQVRESPPWFRPREHAHMLEGLRKAGWEG